MDKNRLEYDNRVNQCFTPVKKEEIESVIRGLTNFKECGHIYWCDWTYENWGTKWNCYEVEERNESIKLETAWTHPVEVFKALSTQFPGVRIKVEFADEDIGSNCGYLVYENGDIAEEDIAPFWHYQTEEERRKWVGLAIKLNEHDQTVDEYLKEIGE